MRPFLTIAALCILLPLSVFCQQPLTYYLPDINYDDEIPTPQSFLGFQIGQWHVSHDQQYHYMKKLAELSPRIIIAEHARSHENRPLIHLIITSERNHKRLQQIKDQHAALSDPLRASAVDISKTPLVLYQGYSIHGDEPSGANAALLIAYYLAAGKGRDIERLLDDVVIILDPCLNPDGFQRFSTWVNMHKNKNQTGDRNDRESNQQWPSGRTNHYWFDLNRDWLLAQHPESKGRLRVFHEWKPNILTDHHEMGADATFFFMPGEPKRTNPITPPRNQELTAKIAEYHSIALDGINSYYYSKEGFDDFYIGKGSTYPDVNGCVGILFEQGGSDGHLKETDNGPLSFDFTVRNQVVTSISTQAAAKEMREELLQFQKAFYETALQEAGNNNTKAYVFGDPHDLSKTNAFLEALRRHHIDVFKLNQSIRKGASNFTPRMSYVVPLEQQQYRLIRGIFEKRTKFIDSIFYDISSWTLPLAYNIPYSELDRRDFSPALLGEKVEGLSVSLAALLPDFSEYGYLFEWNEYYAPKVLFAIQNKGLRAKVSTKPFSILGNDFEEGSIFIPVQNQPLDPESIHRIVQSAALNTGVRVYDVDSGMTPSGIDLGSPSFSTLEKPKVLLAVGGGVSSYDAGEAWHLLDQRYQMEVSKVEIDHFKYINFSGYNTMVLVNGNYNNLSAKVIEKIRQWVEGGGTLIVQKSAIKWAKDNRLANVRLFYPEYPREKSPLRRRRPYKNQSIDAGGRAIDGAIFETELDLSHPLAYGYRRENLPVFRRTNLFLQIGGNPYSTPLIYSKTPLLSGFINDANLDALKSSAAVIVSGLGRGKVICMADSPNFRGYWYGTNKIFANALFFGKIINGRTVEPALPRKETKKPALGEN